MFSRFVAATTLASLLLGSSLANAARVSPMIVEIQPQGGASVARVEMTNDADRDIPFEARLMRGEINEKGELSLTPADDQFLVFPAQTIIQKKSQQVFRIQYVGNPELATSEIYYLSLQQVPVKITPGQNKVQVVVNYNVLVNVVPKDSRPVATVSSVEPVLKRTEPEPDGGDVAASPVAAAPGQNSTVPATVAAAQPPAVQDQPGILVRLTNEGTRYFLAGMSRWEVTGNSSDGTPYSKNFRAEEMTKVIGVGVVGPDRTREFFVPTEVPLAAGTVKVQVRP